MSEASEEPQRPCPSCGSQVKQKNKFCTTCGGVLSATPKDTEEQSAEQIRSPGAGAFLFGLTSSNSLKGKMRGYWQGMIEWAEDLGLAQKILLTLLVLSSAYMLIFYAGLFLALLLMLGLALATTWFSGKSHQWFAALMQRHQILSGVCLLVIICSTPVLVPAIGTFLTMVISALAVIAVAAGAIGVVRLIVVGLKKGAEEQRARDEAHRRWYNSLSEHEKQTYQMEKQTRLMEARNRQAEWERWDREMRRKGY